MIEQKTATTKPLITPKRLLIVWLALVVLTFVGPALAGVPLGMKSAAAFVLMAAGAKFLLISFYFMELATAHALWRALSVAYVAIVALLVWVMA